MKMRGLFAFALIVSAVAAVLGGWPVTHALAQDQGGPPAVRLVVAAQRTVSNGPLFYAAARDFFRDEGLVVELKFFNAAQQGANALAEGEADLAAVELNAPVMNFAGRGTIKAIAGQGREKTDFEGAWLVASTGASAGGFKDIKGLSDRSFALPQIGSIYHYQAAMIARAKGVDFNSVLLKPMQTVDAVAAALTSGQAEAAILPPDYARNYTAASQARQIIAVSSVGEPQLGALFTSPRAIELKRPLLERFVRAYQRGANDYAALLLKRDRFSKRVIDARAHEAALLIAPFVYPGEQPQRSSGLIEVAAPYADPQARIDVADFRTQFAWFKEQGLLDQAADARNALDLSFIKSHLNVSR